jgi:hypothetical protein
MSRLRKCSHGYYGGWGCFDCQVPGLPTQSPLATNVRENGVSINNGQGETADSEQWLIENGYTSFDSETSRFVPNGHSFSDVLSAYGAALRERVRELEAEVAQQRALFVAADSILDEIGDRVNDKRFTLTEENHDWLVSKTCDDRPYQNIVQDYSLLEYYRENRLKREAEARVRELEGALREINPFHKLLKTQEI